MDEKIMGTGCTAAQNIPDARGATPGLSEAEHDAAEVGSDKEEILELDLLEEFERDSNDEPVLATVVLRRS